LNTELLHSGVSSSPDPSISSDGLFGGVVRPYQIFYDTSRLLLMSNVSSRAHNVESESFTATGGAQPALKVLCTLQIAIMKSK
jgi:hypothetical protein